MLSTPKTKSGLFLASSLCDGLEDNNIRQVATLLLNKDADPNILIPTHGVTPFHLVIGNDSEEFAEEVTKLFLRHGGNPNVRSNDGMTPVHVAAAWGRINILQLLLANGGDPLCLDDDGRSPFHYAFDGKYFKAVTMLSNHCENTQNEDDKPKYNIVLDKVLVTNGDIIAEYVASKDTVLDTDNKIRESTLTDAYSCKPHFSINLSCVPDIIDIIEAKYKLPNNLDDYPSRTNDVMTAQLQNNLSKTIKKETSNYSFVDLDFDFANLHLSDVMQKEKCLVSQIINHLSSSLTSDCTTSETLYNYKKDKREENNIVTNNFDIPFQLKKDIGAHYKYNKYYKKPKDFSSKLKNNPDKDILKFSTPNVRKQCLKYSTRSTSKKKHKKFSEKISLTPTHIFDNSIVSMSPNFNTPNHKKKGTNAKTRLAHVCNDSIISKSPNFTTPVCTSRKRNLAKAPHNDNYSSLKVYKSYHEYKTQTQYSELNWYKKHIAQSTPRRKKRSIYKFYSSKKRFDSHRYESDVTSDELSSSNISVDLNKTIFLEAVEDTNCNNILDIESEFSLNFKKSSNMRREDHYNNHLAIKLDEEKYDENDTYDNSDSNLLDGSFNQIEKMNKSVNSFSNNEKYTAQYGNNQINTKFIAIRKNIFKIDKSPETLDTFTNNIKSTHLIESDLLHKENFIDCVDCDTKKLLNEDLNINISKTCNLHGKNWCGDRFHEPLSHELTIENNLSPFANLSMQCKKQMYLPDSQKSCSLKNENSINTKKAEDVPKDKDLDVYKIEKNSSLLSYVSTQEYKYEDPEEGVILIERRLCVTPFKQFCSTFNGSECNIKNEKAMSDASSVSTSQSLPKELLFIDDAALRRELSRLGDQPGPITNTTRQLYQRRLMRLRNVKDAIIPLMPNIPRNRTERSNRIKLHLEFGDWLNHLDTYKSLEKHVFQEFASPDPSRKWREGTSKTSFTYLLLDPRITQDLPNRSVHLTEPEVWSIFLNAIFYIGKGKRSRPFAHLYDAFNIWVNGTNSTNKKINYILDIWNSNHGVICLHVFQNVIPVEAYSREAAMIDALGREHLGNCKGGEYYGITATWSMQQKQNFGRFLLYKASQIFMQEGESQLFPCNL